MKKSKMKIKELLRTKLKGTEIGWPKQIKEFAQCIVFCKWWIWFYTVKPRPLLVSFN